MNIPQPPDLLRLYRDYNSHVMPEKDVRACETQTDETSQMVEEMLNTVQQLEARLATVQKELVCTYDIRSSDVYHMCQTFGFFCCCCYFITVCQVRS